MASRDALLTARSAEPAAFHGLWWDSVSKTVHLGEWDASGAFVTDRGDPITYVEAGSPDLRHVFRMAGVDGGSSDRYLWTEGDFEAIALGDFNGGTRTARAPTATWDAIGKPIVMRDPADNAWRIFWLEWRDTGSALRHALWKAELDFTLPVQVNARNSLRSSGTFRGVHASLEQSPFVDLITLSLQDFFVSSEDGGYIHRLDGTLDQAGALTQHQFSGDGYPTDQGRLAISLVESGKTPPGISPGVNHCDVDGNPSTGGLLARDSPTVASTQLSTKTGTAEWDTVVAWDRSSNTVRVGPSSGTGWTTEVSGVGGNPAWGGGERPFAMFQP